MKTNKLIDKDNKKNIRSEFRVNDYITLKLEDSKPNLYVKGEEFIQCKRLILNIS